MGIQRSARSWKRLVPFTCVLLMVGAGLVRAQELVAFDDVFGIPYGVPLVVEAFGVLDNDVLDGENAGELGATAELVTDVSHGTLALYADGSFTYAPVDSFGGLDSFVYRAVFGAVSDQATVTLSACNGGPDVFECWNESAFLAKAAEHGYVGFQEGFEDDAAWGGARSPNTAATVVSQGVGWQSNHNHSPDWNEITTGPGPARTGQYGAFDLEHGAATGTPTECDIDDPPLHCLYHDGLTGILEPGMSPLHGVGGYFTGIYGANVGIVLDDLTLYGGGQIYGGHQFFGVIDTRPAGFTRFEFREQDGKVGQALYIFADDFTMLSENDTGVPEAAADRTQVSFSGASPNPSNGDTALRFRLPTEADVRLTIYDLRGRVVRRLSDGSQGAGAHVVRWDGLDDRGRRVAAGTYFARLMVTGAMSEDVRASKLVVIH